MLMLGIIKSMHLMMHKSLVKKVKEFCACALCADSLRLATRPVIQVGLAAKTLIVGHAPGSQFHETGIPFNHPIADRLRSWEGIERDVIHNENKFAIVPMCCCLSRTVKLGVIQDGQYHRVTC